MKIHPTFLKIVNYMTGRSNLLGSTIDEWHAMGCPVVEEEPPSTYWTGTTSGMELMTRFDHEKAMAAANARIREIEAIRDGYQQNAANYREIVEKQDARIKELEAARTEGFATVKRTIRNEALEEAATLVEYTTLMLKGQIAEKIRGLKK